MTLMESTLYRSTCILDFISPGSAGADQSHRGACRLPSRNSAGIQHDVFRVLL